MNTVKQMKRSIYSKPTFPQAQISLSHAPQPVMRLLVVARRERGFPSRSGSILPISPPCVPRVNHGAWRERDARRRKRDVENLSRAPNDRYSSEQGTKGILKYSRRRDNTLDYPTTPYVPTLFPQPKPLSIPIGRNLERCEAQVQCKKGRTKSGDA
jgi:hypothetical protein